MLHQARRGSASDLPRDTSPKAVRPSSPPPPRRCPTCRTPLPTPPFVRDSIRRQVARSDSIRRQATMASATLTATMAASGYDKRNSTSTYSSSSSSTLQTPGSGVFPSEIRSPMAYSPGLGRGDALKTPITPPSAYLDFLKAMSPAIQSPMSTSTSSRFHFNDKPMPSPRTSQPALSRNTSYESDASAASAASAATASTSTTSEQTTAAPIKPINTSSIQRNRPESPRIIIPPSPFAKPGPRSARTPRRLQIPQSPYSPAMNTSTSLQSPYTSTPLSAAPWSASFSPRDADAVEANGKPGRVSVRHVVTRTVTYCRTPLEPAPRGKRRKLDISEPAELSKVTEMSGASSDEDTAAASKKPDVSKKVLAAPVVSVAEIKKEVIDGMDDAAAAVPPLQA